MLTGKEALLLDMNGTFMFGEDRFGDAEDFSAHYYKIGGTRPKDEINAIVLGVYGYLEARYPDPRYRHCFPSVEQAIREVIGRKPDKDETTRIVDTFAFHELGRIPEDYAAALHRLRKGFMLAAVIDIWSPKGAWLKAFDDAGIAHLFSALSFSSDHGMVKPSPRPFERVVNTLGVSNADALVIGDSPRRDLGGAANAGIDGILVGGAEHPDALGTFANLLELCEAL